MENQIKIDYENMPNQSNSIRGQAIEINNKLSFAFFNPPYWLQEYQADNGIDRNADTSHNRPKSKYAAGISHKIGTPINPSAEIIPETKILMIS